MIPDPQWPEFNQYCDSQAQRYLNTLSLFPQYEKDDDYKSVLLHGIRRHHPRNAAEAEVTFDYYLKERS